MLAFNLAVKLKMSFNKIFKICRKKSIKVQQFTFNRKKRRKGEGKSTLSISMYR